MSIRLKTEKFDRQSNNTSMKHRNHNWLSVGSEGSIQRSTLKLCYANNQYYLTI